MKLVRLGYIFLIIFFVITLSLNSQEDRIEKLREKILKQQEVIKELEKRTEIKEEKDKNFTENIIKEYLTKPETQESGILTGYNKGFFITSADEDFKLKINGYLRYHTIWAEPNTVQNDTFRHTESRIDFHIYFLKDWHIRIRPDFSNGNTGQPRLREAYAEYLGVPFLKPRIGTFIVPFSEELNQNPTEYMGIVSPVFNLAGGVPFRDTGAMIYGDGLPFFLAEFTEDFLSYAVGVFNGDGLNTLNVDDDVMLVAKARLYPLTRKENFFLWMSVFYGDTDFREDGARLRLPGLQNHEVFEGNNLNQNYDDTNGPKVGVGTGIKYVKDGLRIEGEYIWVRHRRNFDEGDAGSIQRRLSALEMWGASIGVSYFFNTCDEDEHQGVEPLFRFAYTTMEDRNGDGSTTTEQPFGTIDDFKGQDVWELTFGIKYHLNKHVRVDFNWMIYDLKETSGGLSNNNRGSGGGLMHAYLFQVMTKWQALNIKTILNAQQQ